MTLFELQRSFPNEDACRAWLEAVRWPHGPECPACGTVGRAAPIKNRPKWSCISCRAQFSVTAGTPMHKTHLPLTVWITAMWLMACSSKGISAKKLGEWLGLPYRTAWHLSHRIRAMMTEDSPMLRGLVEIDETYAGAPPRKQAAGSSSVAPSPTGRGSRRPLVLAAAERGGRVRAATIASHSRSEIGAAVEAWVQPGSTVFTDALPAYRHLGGDHRHLAVTHSAREFARTDPASGLRVHVNTVESWNSMLQRAVVGVFHWISRKHLDRYVTEATFRWNHREERGAARLRHMISLGAGRVLPFRHLVGSAA